MILIMIFDVTYRLRRGGANVHEYTAASADPVEGGEMIYEIIHLNLEGGEQMMNDVTLKMMC